MAPHATGELLIPRTDKGIPKITELEIRERAYRTCPIGSAACEFGGVELQPIAGGKTEVAVMCGAVACGNNDARLQTGLSRLKPTS